MHETIGSGASVEYGAARFVASGHTAWIRRANALGRALIVALLALAAAILSDLGDVRPSSFRVSARRADKRFPLTSPQIEREVGGRIKDARGWKVDLSKPDFTRKLADELDGMIRSGHVRPIVGNRFPLEQAGEAMRLIEERGALGKVVLDVAPHA